MSHKAPEIHTKTASEARLVSVDCRGKLNPDGTEDLSGSVTVPAVSGITIANEAVSTAILSINGDDVPIGQAVQMLISGGTAGTTYTVSFTVGTDSSPAQTIEGAFDIEVH